MKHFIFLITLFCTIAVFGQKQEESLLITFDNSWQKETISMPLHFAPQIPYKGVEEIRFHKGWAKKESNGFWTYAFLWNIDLTETLTANQLQLYMQYYFDGLMNIVNKDKSKKVPKTVALFLQKNLETKANHFVGKIQLYDAFHTKDMITLNCTVLQYNCEEKKKSMILFHFSPKEFEHTIWNELYTVKLKEKPCKG